MTSPLKHLGLSACIKQGSCDPVSPRGFRHQN